MQKSQFWQDMKQMRKAWLLFAPWMLFYAASYFQRTAVPGTIFETFQSEYGLTAVEIAGLTSAFVYIYSPFQVVIGMLVEKFGGVRTVTAGGFFLCVGAVAFPLICGNLPLMYFCRFLTGLGASTIYLSLVKETDRVFGRKNYPVMLGIVYFTGYGGGLIGTLPLKMACDRFNWNHVLLIVGLLSVLLYAMFFSARRCVTLPPVQTKKISLLPLWSIVKNPLTHMIVFCGTVGFSFNSILQMVFGQKLISNVAGLGKTSASAIIFFQMLTCMITLLGGGVLVRFTGNRRKPLMYAAVVLLLLNTIMMYCAIRYHLHPGFIIAGFLLYAVGSGISIGFTLACQEVNSRDCNALSAGYNNFGNYLAIAVFSPLIGKLFDSYIDHSKIQPGQAVDYPLEAYETLFLIMLIPTTISLIATFFIPETKGHFLRQHPSDSSEQYRHFLQANRH